MSKSILVTGAASGIGLALSEHFLKEGYHVVLTDLDEEALKVQSEKLSVLGGRLDCHVLDVTDPSQIDAVTAAFPHIDILVNNAGVQYVAPLEEFPVERWRLINDVLLVGPAMLCRAVLPGMKSRQFGRIINIGSIHALVASPYKSAYVAAKHGLVGFSKVIALETAKTNITINTICPSYVKTPLVDKQVQQQAQSHGISEAEVIENIMLEPMPKKAFIGMDELFGAVSFLSSDAAKNMTGQTLVLDGGWTIK